MTAPLLLTLAALADILTTLAVFKRGGYEQNVLFYGKHPSTAILCTLHAVVVGAVWYFRAIPAVDTGAYIGAAVLACAAAYNLILYRRITP